MSEKTRMRESEWAGEATFDGGGWPIRLVMAAIAAAILLGAIPALASAQDNLTDEKKDKTTLIGKTLNFGVVTQDALPATYQIYIRTNNSSGGCNAAGGSCDRREVDVNVRLNDPAYERGGGNCDVRTPDSGWTFQARLSYKDNDGGNCSIDLHLKAGTPPGNYDTTLDFASAFGGWNGSNQPGSATILGTVTAESGNVIRTYDQDEAEVSALDFGEVAVDDAVTRTITLVNRGTSVMSDATRTLTGSDSYSIEDSTCGATLGLVSSCTVTIRYEPTASTEDDDAELTFGSSSGHARTVSLSGSAIGPTAGVTVTPDTADFGTTPAGVPVQKSFQVQNTGNTNLDLGTVVDPGPHADQVELSAGDNPCGATLVVGASCDLRVAFAPVEEGDARQDASFTVTGSSPLVSEPARSTVPLTVERVAPVAAIEVLDAAGETPVSEQDLGLVPVGTGVETTFTIRNAGNVTVPSLTPSFTGGWASDFEVVSSTCGEIPRDGSCQITVRYQASSGGAASGSLVLTPGEAPVRAGAATVALTAQGSGVRILNDDLLNLSGVNQKIWLDTLTSGAAASPGDRIRVAFEVQKGSDETIEDLLVSTVLPKTDTVPEPESFIPIPNGLGKVEIHQRPGSGTALVIGEFPAVAIYGANVKTYGLDDDSGTRTYLGQKVPYTCGGDPTTGIGDGNGGKSKTDDRRIWLRVRTASGELSQIVGSIVRFGDARIPRACGGGPLLYDQQVSTVGGVDQPPATLNAVAGVGEPVSFTFRTNASRKAAQADSAANVNGIGWRIRNSRTGDMFVRDGEDWAACAAPCTSEDIFTAASGNSDDYADTSPDLVRTLSLPYGLPSRGRWIVEASVRGTDRVQQQFQEVGSVLVNSTASSPEISLTGTPPARPDTDSAWTIDAQVNDSADQPGTHDSLGGHPQVIEWDLNNDPTDGPAGDGFEIRYEGPPSGPLPDSYLSQEFSTAGRAPGPYTIRARVTDNGALDAADPASRSAIASSSFTINSAPEARSETVEFEADAEQPGQISFQADDPDQDDYTVDVTPDAGNEGSLDGDGTSRGYSWPAEFTGSDSFDFTATDDKGGQGPAGQLTVRVRPDTTLDRALIAGVPRNPRPGEGYLGATTETAAEFDFSSPQNPVVGFECRHLLDAEVVTDWSDCADESTGEIDLDDLADGLHRLEVRAVNDEGMVDGSPAARSWRVDNTAPVTEVRSAPPSGQPGLQPRPTNDDTPTYSFRASTAERSPQAQVSYECRLLWGPEAGNWMSCGGPSDDDGSGPVDVVGSDPGFGISDPLPEGTYEIEARATDEVGNTGPVTRDSFTVDLAPPVTSVSSGPYGLIASREVTYQVTSTEASSTFVCELTGDEQGVVFPAGPCPGGSSPNFTGLADDNYSLTVAAADPATNRDPEPPTIAFEVDGTAPQTTSPTVDFGTGETEERLTGSRRITVGFDGSDSRRMDGFQCRLDSDADEDWNVCSPPETLSGLGDGEHRIEIRSRDEAGNVDLEPLTIAWTIDNQAPVTVIDSGPDPVTNDSDPTIGFSTPDDTAGSDCRLDGGEWETCSSPIAPATLAGGELLDGPHHLAIRSVDLAGNEESTPALVGWTQDTISPVVDLIARPAATMPAGDAEFGWKVKDGDPPVDSPEARSECSIDGGSWEPCGRSLTIEAPAAGSHVFAVRATDAAGNLSSEIGHVWTVAGAAPVAPTIDASDPSAGEETSQVTASFAFSHPGESDEWFDGFECRLDSAAWEPCESPFEESGLADGPHVFAVRVRDKEGNLSPEASRSWEVRTSAPVTSIDRGPSGLLRQREATILFSADRESSFECSLDDGEWGPCSSPLNLEDLGDGDHQVAVRATSNVTPVGVTDPTPAIRRWSVDATPPGTTITESPEGDTEDRVARVAFTTDEAGAGFQCSLDGAPFNTCESPLTIDGLGYGDHVIEVRAVDAAGNVDPEPESAGWKVVAPPPEPCPDGQVGTPPDCTDLPDDPDPVCDKGEIGVPPDCRTPLVDLAVGKVKLTRQKVGPGGKVKLKVRLVNRGELAADRSRLCLKTPKKLIKGKGKRCLETKVPAGRTVTVAFVLRTKKDRVRGKTAVLKLSVPTGQGTTHKTIKRRITIKGRGGKS